MPDADDDLRVLFHRLNNALGVILAHAELLHTKAPDDQNRARAAHVVESALDAMTTVREIRQRVPRRSTPRRALIGELTPGIPGLIPVCDCRTPDPLHRQTSSLPRPARPSDSSSITFP